MGQSSSQPTLESPRNSNQKTALAPDPAMGEVAVSRRLTDERARNSGSSPESQRNDITTVQVPDSQPGLPSPAKPIETSMPPPNTTSLVSRSSAHTKDKGKMSQGRQQSPLQCLRPSLARAKNKSAQTVSPESAAKTSPASIPPSRNISKNAPAKRRLAAVHVGQTGLPVDPVEMQGGAALSTTHVDGQADDGSSTSVASENSGRSGPSRDSFTDNASSRSTVSTTSSTGRQAASLEPIANNEEQAKSKYPSQRKHKAAARLKISQLDFSPEDIRKWAPPVRGLDDAPSQGKSPAPRPSNNDELYPDTTDVALESDDDLYLEAPMRKPKKARTSLTKKSATSIEEPLQDEARLAKKRSAASIEEPSHYEPRNAKRRLKNEVPWGRVINTSDSAAEKAMAAARDLSIKPHLQSGGEFTDDEEELLRRALKDYQDRRGLELDDVVEIIHRTAEYQERPGDAQEVEDLWRELGAANPERTIIQIRRHVRAKYHVNKNGAWTPAEDEKLLGLLNMYKDRPNKWMTISLLMGGRSNLDCQNRWKDYLQHNGKLRMGRWTADEDSKLIEAIKVVIQLDEEVRAKEGLPAIAKYDGGHIDWSKVSSTMNGERNRLQCFQRWRVMTKRDTTLEVHPVYVGNRTPDPNTPAEASVAFRRKMRVKKDNATPMKRRKRSDSEPSRDTQKRSSYKRQKSKTAVEDNVDDTMFDEDSTNVQKQSSAAPEEPAPELKSSAEEVNHMLPEDKFELVNIVFNHVMTENYEHPEEIDWHIIKSELSKPWSPQALQLALEKLLKKVNVEQELSDKLLQLATMIFRGMGSGTSADGDGNDVPDAKVSDAKVLEAKKPNIEPQAVLSSKNKMKRPLKPRSDKLISSSRARKETTRSSRLTSLKTSTDSTSPRDGGRVKYKAVKNLDIASDDDRSNDEGTETSDSD